MGVRKKGRRKIVCEQKTYIWYVSLDDESPYYILHIVSEDKQLVLACPLHTDTAYVISKGKRFQNLTTNGRWNRYLLPFPVPEIITPKFVSELAAWAENGSDAVKVAWNGKDIII